MKTYKDKVSGETLYVIKNRFESGRIRQILYYKDPECTIIHRVDGPAEKWYDGEEFWVQNSRYHRLDGPAEKYRDGRLRWWVDGVKIDLDALTIMQEKLTK